MRKFNPHLEFARLGIGAIVLGLFAAFVMIGPLLYILGLGAVVLTPVFLIGAIAVTLVKLVRDRLKYLRGEDK